MPTLVPDSAACPVTEPSQVGEARRLAAMLAGYAGLDETQRGRVGLVVNEAGNNLVNHARGGELVIRAVRRELDGGAENGIEILALDRGPGIASISRALRDGYSTAGTPGNGLGAIRRLSGEFDIFSAVESSITAGGGAGTALLSRLWAGGPDANGNHSSGLEAGVVCLPKAGEEACGDAWAMVETGGSITLVVADGLGHGLHAAEASGKAVRLVRENAARDPAALIQVLHAGLRGTRGAAVAVARIDLPRREIHFAGVGNISAGVVAAGTARNMVSHNGTVGAELRRTQEFTYPFPPGALLIFHSDGLATQWQLGKYPGLRDKHPALVAAVLYRDFRRARDDVTVLVARRKGERLVPGPDAPGPQPDGAPGGLGNGSGGGP